MGRERYNQEMAVDGREQSVGSKANEICMKMTYCDLLVCMLIKNKNVFSKYLKKTKPQKLKNAMKENKFPYVSNRK